MNIRELFENLYKASTESDVDKIISGLDVHQEIGWLPYGQNESYFGVIENQQASPIPALVEKITNSIDAILMRRCREEGIDPKSNEAPRSMEEAIKCFFPNSPNWDLPGQRGLQAENIQIIADGPRQNTSLIIYDDGEGQHPDKFEETFLSLLRGNKNEIQFVQGKYNMGGAGAVVFCGKKRYQLVASKKYDKCGEFGFTIIRKHPLSEKEQKVKKNTWYEYLVINGKIPRFHIEKLDLGLHKRQFITGTVIKLYSYDLPSGSRSVISRDLNQSINEYLFEPALPIFTIDKKERYPDDKNLERHLYGLKRRMEEDNNKYIKEIFSETHVDNYVGSLKITVYVFNPKIDDKSAKESKDSIKREFFKSNMSVLFSLNGQVQGHYTSEFITRSLKFQLLKDYLLIHVDCTNLNLEYRNELFMASRDRLKNGEESSHLRSLVADTLSKGRLKEIYKLWRDSITTQSENTADLLKDFSKSLPLNNDLVKLLNNTFKLDIKNNAKNNTPEARPNKKIEDEYPFNPKRFPSIFNIDKKSEDENSIPIIKIPMNGEKTILFNTDVEDQYFDRIEEPGDLKLAILSLGNNDGKGGNKPGEPKQIEHIINVSISSPNKGKIRINMHPTKEVQIGDSLRIKATLTSPNGDLDQIFMVKITDKQKPKTKIKEPKIQTDNIGLPKLQEVYKDKVEGKMAWEDLGGYGIHMEYGTIMHPFLEGEKLDTIFINMDSSVLKTYRGKLKTEEQIIIADRRYISRLFKILCQVKFKFPNASLTGLQNGSPVATA